MARAVKENIEERKKDILEAALYCFTNFGYSKTSMDDVAKRAGISRPLIYLKFKNKEDLLLGLFEHLMEGRIEAAEAIAADKTLTKKEKLEKMIDTVKIQPWSRISGCPMSDEFFNSCSNIDQKAYEKFQKQKIKILTDILGDKMEAEIFAMAAEGFVEDVPTCSVLRKRFEILIDKFGK